MSQPRPVNLARRPCRQWDRSFDAFNLGDGIENVYTAIPGAAGAADTVTDTLVTPWGDLNLDSLVAGIDAASALDPGAAFDAATSAASAIDPLAFLGL